MWRETEADGRKPVRLAARLRDAYSDCTECTSDVDSACCECAVWLSRAPARAARAACCVLRTPGAGRAVQLVNVTRDAARITGSTADWREVRLSAMVWWCIARHRGGGSGRRGGSTQQASSPAGGSNELRHTRQQACGRPGGGRLGALPPPRHLQGAPRLGAGVCSAAAGHRRWRCGRRPGSAVPGHRGSADQTAGGQQAAGGAVGTPPPGPDLARGGPVRAGPSETGSSLEPAAHGRDAHGDDGGGVCAMADAGAFSAAARASGSARTGAVPRRRGAWLRESRAGAARSQPPPRRCLGAAGLTSKQRPRPHASPCQRPALAKLPRPPAVHTPTTTTAPPSSMPSDVPGTPRARPSALPLLDPRLPEQLRALRLVPPDEGAALAVLGLSQTHPDVPIDDAVPPRDQPPAPDAPFTSAAAAVAETSSASQRESISSPPPNDTSATSIMDEEEDDEGVGAHPIVRSTLDAIEQAKSRSRLVKVRHPFWFGSDRARCPCCAGPRCAVPVGD